MITLFELGDNNMATLNKEWISLIPEFRKLLARDKGGPADGSGKYKKQAMREFTYIYHMYDFRSVLENYTEEEREAQALEWSDLTKGKVASDGDLWDAIRMYQQLMKKVSPSLQSWRSMKLTAKNTDDYLNTVNLNDRTDAGAKIHSIKEIQDGIKGMPEVWKAVVKMERQVQDEISGTGLRGDAEKGGDEDPD